MTPDVVVPMPLLLPAPEATDHADDVVVGNFDGPALVRGAQLAFAGEPELAAHIVGERKVRELDTSATDTAPSPRPDERRGGAKDGRTGYSRGPTSTYNKE